VPLKQVCYASTPSKKLGYCTFETNLLESILPMVQLKKPRTFIDYSVYGTLELIVSI